MSQRALPLFALKDPAGMLAAPPDFIEMLPIAAYACDAKGRLCWFNERAADLWGRRPRIGDDTELFCGSFKLYGLDGSLIGRDETPMAYVLANGEPVHGREATVERPDGSRIVAMVHIDPVKDSNGNLLGAINCFHDVTELHRIKTEQAEGGAIVRQVLDALPAAIYTTDAQGRITYFNPAAVELAGRTPTLGSDEWCVTWRLFAPDGQPLSHDECPMALALKEDRAIRGVEAIAERPDGTRRPFLPFPTPVHDLSGKLVGAVNMLIDITERKESEAQQRKMLSELNHRVKNNMQMLHALLRGVQRETQSPEAKAVLAEAGQRIGAMAAAQQVLYDSQNSSEFDATDFLDAICRTARQTFGRDANIEMRATRASLPNDTAIPLALILNELISNAVKHARGVRPGVAVRVSLQQTADGWRLEVADDGPGFTLDPARRRASGLGLVGGLAAQLGGSLAVSNDKGAHCIIDFVAAPKSH
jgi:PAS domain S-box-containing protein